MSSSPLRVDAATPKPPIWWSNAVFFVGTHLLTLWLITTRAPPSSLRLPTALLTLIVWQTANFGITIGYHRLYSHRSFRAAFSVRLILALIGASAFQGSIKFQTIPLKSDSYALKRFADDPVHDPYAATRGLFFSHMGWIFFKPRYEKLRYIEKQDLERDPVVRLQHEYYVPLALFSGLAVPALIGSLWNDAFGAFVWASLLGRIMIWHTTFTVNSLAHWSGLQIYTDEVTAKGNLLFALITAGEGNHNFHAFPHDYRAGPSPWDFDPSKWIIALLHRCNLVRGLRRARQENIMIAKSWMKEKCHAPPSSNEIDVHSWRGDSWGPIDIFEFLRDKPNRCLLLIDGYVVDTTEYLGEHPGGANVLRSHALKMSDYQSIEDCDMPDTTWAFYGGLNNHSRVACLKLREMRLARFVPG